MSRRPRYPIYIISKGRADRSLTARFLARDGVPFRLVVEEPELSKYQATVRRLGLDPDETIRVLPFADLGLGGIPARNWCWEDAIAGGHARHWILDDNIMVIRRLYAGRRIPCNAGPAFAAVEDFVERYENVGVAGLNYQMFGVPGSPAYRVNVHVYSCILIANDRAYRWRGRYNEDTDLCLQALHSGDATILVNVFLADKQSTMTMAGGNEAIYAGDGRLQMARALERQWPGVASVRRRYGRVTHFVDWTRFRDEPRLRLRADVDLAKLPPFDEYGLRLAAVKRVRSPALREVAEEYARLTSSNGHRRPWPTDAELRAGDADRRRELAAMIELDPFELLNRRPA